MKPLLAVAALTLCLYAYGAEMPTSSTHQNSIGMSFVRVEPGTFRMGAGTLPLPEGVVNINKQVNGDFDEVPARDVTITQPFYVGMTEVTNAQYEAFDPVHRNLRGKLGFSKGDDEAVVYVDWHEATRFCEWLSAKEGLPYRLPTEAEWEYACRAGTTTHFSQGDILGQPWLDRAGESWYPDPTRKPDTPNNVAVYSVKVGQTPANPWGIYDMHGNVEEWCSDWYGPYDAADTRDPVGRERGQFRVTRGGAHSTELYYLRSENRSAAVPEDKHWLIGLRVVIGPLPKTKPLPSVGFEAHQSDVRTNAPSEITKGPDPALPYFKGPRRYVNIADDAFGPIFAEHNHVPGLIECPNGDLLAVWYTCIRERGRELGAVASRLRYDKEEWEPASSFWDVPDRNDHAPALWYDGDRTIYHFEGLSAAGTWGNLATIMRRSTDSGATWSDPVIIAPEHGLRQMPIESTIRLQDGTIVLPCDAVTGGIGGTALLASIDNGVSWKEAGGTIAGIHAGVVQLKDGRLLALGRGDTIDGRMPMSISSDRGAKWTYSASPFPTIGGGQRLVLRRLQEGPIFLASFANEPVTITDASGANRSIKGLFAALSYDEGVTWTIKRAITDDGPGREVESMDGNLFTMSWENAEPKSYLAMWQAKNGVIHLIGSRQHYAFNYKWIETPAPASPVQ